MSNKLSMPSIDKVQIKVQIKVPTYVRLEKTSKAAHISLNALCSAMLDDATASIEYTAEDVTRAREIVDANIARREAAKKEKGLM